MHPSLLPVIQNEKSPRRSSFHPFYCNLFHTGIADLQPGIHILIAIECNFRIDFDLQHLDTGIQRESKSCRPAVIVTGCDFGIDSSALAVGYLELLQGALYANDSLNGRIDGQGEFAIFHSESTGALDTV